MKKLRIFVTAIAFCLASLSGTLSAQQVYQLPNPGFEQWDATSLTAEPTHWNSFATADGSWAWAASSPHHYHRNGGRPGTTGSSYLTIYSTSVMNIVANGNMTTGRIHIGSTSTTSTDNYNYTQRTNNDHCQPFHGTPDSMYVWVSFYAASATSQAQVKAVVHCDNNFQSPNHENNPALFRGIADATFTRTTTSPSTMQWQQMKVPFTYNVNTLPVSYILINLTTNHVAASGSANDSLSIDDIEFIYSAWLTDLTLNGSTLDGFQMDVFDYSATLADTAALTAATVAVQTQADDATPVIATSRLTDSTALVTITVTAEDGTTVKVYHVNLSAPMPAHSDPEPPAPVDTVQYSVTVTCDTTMGSVSPAGEILVDSAATLTVTATAHDGYRFTGWSIDPGYTTIITDNPYTFTVTSDVTVTAHFEADSNVSIDPPERPSVTVYPNPTDGKTTVVAEGTVELTDLGGRIIATWQGGATLDLGGLPAGVYLLRCNGKAHKIIKR